MFGERNFLARAIRNIRASHGLSHHYHHRPHQHHCPNSRHSIRSFSQPSSRSSSPSSSSTAGIAFDIDGVLLRGKQLIPQATEALHRISPVNMGGKAKEDDIIPYMFLTNGGGVIEAEKARELSEWFKLSVPEDIVCVSHSPMKELVQKHADSQILVLGMTDVKSVALHYGFKHVLTMAELSNQFPSLTPHLHRESTGGGTTTHKITTDHIHEYPSPETVLKALQQIKAIFVLHDPNQWYRDLQITLDVLTASDDPPPIYFSNPDIVFSSLHAVPRLAQGAYRVCLQALYHELTGEPLDCILYGKPELVTYRYAETLLQRRAQALGYNNVHRYYMIGDNPAADIRGANRAGQQWTSILVKSGTIPVSRYASSLYTDMLQHLNSSNDSTANMIPLLFLSSM